MTLGELTVQLGVDGTRLTAAQKQIEIFASKATTSARVATAGLNKVDQAAGMLSNTFAKLGIAIGATLVASKIIQFTKESITAALAVEGITSAYEKMQKPITLMNDLKRATRGALDESDLMALTIKAANFGIPFKDLAKYLNFATERAITTGKSIKDLTENIVVGVGRQSTRSLIELGIGVKDLGEKIKKTGTFAGGMGLIVDRELAKMGVVLDTVGVKVDRYHAGVQNLKEAWGGYLIQNKLVNTMIENSTETLNRLADSHLTFWQKAMWSGKQYEDWLSHANLASKDEKNLAGAVLFTPGFGGAGKGSLLQSVYGSTGAATQVAKQVETLNSLKLKLEEATAALGDMNLADQTGINRQLDLISGYQKRIDLLTGVTKVTKEQKQATDDLNKAIREQLAYLHPSRWDVLNLLGNNYQAKGKMTPNISGMNSFVDKDKLRMQDELNKKLQMTNTLVGGATDLFEAMGAAMAGSQNAGQAMAQALLKTGQQIISMLLEQAFANLLLADTEIAAKEAKKGLIGIATAALGIALLSGIMAGAKNSAKTATKMAQGGLVPGGYPNDTFPALLTSGERVIPAGQRGNMAGMFEVKDIIVEGRKLRMVLKNTDDYMKEVL